MSSNETSKNKVTIIGSGNWGCAAARLAALNAAELDEFDTTVRMWVYEEMVEGEKLSEIINTRHENVKYLAGVELPENLVAVPDLIESVEGSNLLVFVTPHQFVQRLCNQIKESGKLAEGATAISLIKGLDYDENGPILISKLISDSLGIDTCVLSGANIADEVARDKFAEATIGYSVEENAKVYKALFHRDMFRINIVPDVIGVQLCGALKNIVALAAGFSDGLGYGSNTKSALMRIGMMEMQEYSRLFYGDEGISDRTLLESCGMADLITTCFNGRNRKCAEAFVTKTAGETWEEIEKELLNGQKLQGTLTLKEVVHTLEGKGDKALEQFPLFAALFKIAFEGVAVEEMLALV